MSDYDGDDLRNGYGDTEVMDDYEDAVSALMSKVSNIEGDMGAGAFGGYTLTLVSEHGESVHFDMSGLSPADVEQRAYDAGEDLSGDWTALVHHTGDDAGWEGIADRMERDNGPSEDDE